MNRIARTTRIAAAAGVALALALPASQAFAASRKTEHAVTGAAIGALAGALLSHGDTTATLGGAAAGALLGSATTHNDRYGRSAYQTRYYQQPSYGYGRGYRVDDRRDDRRYERHDRYDGYGRYDRPVEYRYYGR